MSGEILSLFTEHFTHGGRSEFHPAVQLSNKARDTSIAAAKNALPHTGTARRRVLDYITSQGYAGCTDEQGAEALGMAENTYRPRRYELAKAGLIIDSGDRQPTRSLSSAICWMAAEFPKSTSPESTGTDDPPAA